MGLIAKRVADKRILKLIRGFFTAVAGRGPCQPNGGKARRRAGRSRRCCQTDVDVLDKELEKRGHHFVRYADTTATSMCASQRAGERVLAGVRSSWPSVSS